MICLQQLRNKALRSYKSLYIYLSIYSFYLLFIDPLHTRSVALQDLIEHVKSGKACVVLVDMNCLVCNKCAPKWWKKSAERVLPPSAYRGHYVILLEWLPTTDEFAFRDPDRADGEGFS